jgi:UPF0755 protein
VLTKSQINLYLIAILKLMTNSNKQTRGKWLLYILGGLLLLATISLIVGWWWLGQNMAAVSTTPEQVEFLVTQGSNTREVSRSLKKAGLIKSDLVFKAYARYKGLDKKIQAGMYTLDKSWSLDQIVNKLLKNPSGVTVVLIEGWRREQMALALGKAFGGQNSNFDENKFVELTENMEGELFPDTYQFELFANEEKVIKVLNDRYKSVIANIKKQGQAQNYTDKELNTVASLIERESANDSDRRKVAGVLFNRLENNMPLQIDATLQFVRATRVCGQKAQCNDWWPGPRVEDKELVSPYNTYLVTGLPPGAISSTGKAVLEAAYNPESSEFFYYLTDNNGITHYAVSYDQHLANINRYLRQ